MNRTENKKTIHASVSRCFLRSFYLLSEFIISAWVFSFQPINQSIYTLVNHAEEKRERTQF